MKRLQAASVMVCFASIWAAPALADSNSDMAQCDGTIISEKPTPELAIKGCSALIQSGEMGPGNLATVYYNRGNAYYDTKQFALAIPDYDHALLIKPDYASAMLNRGLAKVKSGDRVGGEADLKAAKALKAQQHP